MEEREGEGENGREGGRGRGREEERRGREVSGIYRTDKVNEGLVVRFIFF